MSSSKVVLLQVHSVTSGSGGFYLINPVKTSGTVLSLELVSGVTDNPGFFLNKGEDT